MIEDWSHRGRKNLCQAAEGRASRETTVYTLDGKPAGTDRLRRNRLCLRASTGRTTDRYGYFSFQSFIHAAHASTGWIRSPASGRSFSSRRFPSTPASTSSSRSSSSRRTARSVPMFIAGKKGLKQDGTERLLMTGYGGFNLSETPVWNPAVRLVAGAGRLVRAAQPARRRRVRRAAGTSRACLRRSRTSSTTGSPRPST